MISIHDFTISGYDSGYLESIHSFCYPNSNVQAGNSPDANRLLRGIAGGLDATFSVHLT
jgi:hypothetical protein